MYLYPSDIFEKLEFDKILNLVSKYCVSDKASAIAQRMQLFNNANRIQRSLEEVWEYRMAMDAGDYFAIQHYEAIEQDLYLLAKEGYALDVDQHLRIFSILKMIEDMVQFFSNPEVQRTYPSLFEITTQVDMDPALIKAYYRVFDDEGNIKPNASPALATIIKSIRSKEIEIDKTFVREMKAFKENGLLSDTAESYKNGRRVLSVQAENKRKIKGIIHDESATGKTVFIEPQAIIELNNLLLELVNEKRQEIYRILRALSDQVRPFVSDLDLWQKIIVRFDLICAKAKLSALYGGNKVEIKDEKMLDIKQARHPLLTIINNEQQKPTIDFDLKLQADKSILVISGPNAGGKSVTMKAVGLIQMMLQSGMLVPVAANSKMGLFDSFYADIGDQQSLEEDLSTYSSRLENMKVFIKKANRKSLVLIDEFGSGTDPQAGGAIAESILNLLVQKKTFGVITTHYSNIKMYAFNNDQIQNGAMLFDQESLSPKYELEVGKPGSSYAFEIATKIGMPKHIIDYAQNKIGKKNKAVEELLVELQNEKQVLEEKLAFAEKEKKDLSRLMKNYEQLSLDLEIKRKRLKIKEKEGLLSGTIDQDKAIQKMIKEIREEKDIDKAKALSAKLRQDKKSLKEEMIGLSEEAYVKKAKEAANLKVGDYVKLVDDGNSGELLAIKKGVATVQMGIIKMEVPLKELLPAKEPIVVNRTKSIKSNVVLGEVETKIDLRGYTKADAAHFLQEFVDKAIMSRHTYFEILHGKGNGVLRNMVLSKLKEYRDVKNVRHPEEEYGGNGITKFDL